MPAMSNTISVAANAVSSNIFDGQLFDFLTKNSLISFRFSGALTGIYATLMIGGVTVLAEALVSDSNRFPVAPDDVLLVVGGRRGARLYGTLRNSTGAAIIVEWVADIS